MGPGSVNFGSTVLPKTTVSPPLPSAFLGGFLFFLHSLECPLSSHHPGVTHVATATWWLHQA